MRDLYPPFNHKSETQKKVKISDFHGCEKQNDSNAVQFYFKYCVLFLMVTMNFVQGNTDFQIYMFYVRFISKHEGPYSTI